MENYGIKIIYAPEITLVGEPRFLGMPQEIMEQWDTDIHWDKINNFDNINAEYILEAAGRGCYQSWANKAKRKMLNI